MVESLLNLFLNCSLCKIRLDGVNTKNNIKSRYINTRFKRLLYLKKKQKILIYSKTYLKLFRRSVFGYSKRKKKNRNRRFSFIKKRKILHFMIFLN